MYFETHAHYNDSKYDEDREELLSSLKKFGISYLINIGTDIDSSLESINLAKKYDYIYASVGFHPNYAQNMKSSDIYVLEELCKNEKVVAIGEIGLDFHYDYAPKDVQKKAFKDQLMLAKKLNKPIIVHSREASQDVFNYIKESKVEKGVIHAYSGSTEMALDYAKLGFFVGIGGVVTFKNAKKLVDVVKNVPLKNILIETDSPYLTPEPFRGKRNDSKNLEFVVKKITEIKGISKEEVCNVTFENAVNLFLN